MTKYLRKIVFLHSCLSYSCTNKNRITYLSHKSPKIPVPQHGIGQISLILSAYHRTVMGKVFPAVIITLHKR